MRSFPLHLNALIYNIALQETSFFVILFQAIECSLAGIKPQDGGTWPEDATDVMYEFCDNSNALYVKVCNSTHISSS
jgi:hypothetical protein